MIPRMSWAPRQAWEALSPRQKVLGFLAVLGGTLAGFVLMAWMYGTSITDFEEVRRFAEAQPEVRRILGDRSGLAIEGATGAHEYGFGASWTAEVAWREKSIPISHGSMVLEGSRFLSRRTILKAEFRSPDGRVLDLSREAEDWFLRGKKPR